MPTFDPDKNPKGLITLIVAAGLLIFRSGVFGAKSAFDAAEEFTAEAEKRLGDIKP